MELQQTLLSKSEDKKNPYYDGVVSETKHFYASYRQLIDIPSLRIIDLFEKMNTPS